MEKTAQQIMTDNGIRAMYKFLKDKASRHKKTTNHALEMYHVTNTDSLQFFEIMFKNDLERLGLL